MKALVIGKGGREHAIVRALSESTSCETVYALPGNQGMQEQAKLVDLPLAADSIVPFCQDEQIDLVVVGPEDPLVDGLASELRQAGLKVFGPGQDGAQLEGSKIFSKEFMEKYDIPTATFLEVGDVEQVMQEAERFKPPWVLKADGLAAGKGVFICKTLGELKDSATDIFEKKTLGSAGDRALLEQFHQGYELSYFVLTNGEGYVSLPMAQDHKRIGDGDTGPNTGGMGTVAPVAIADDLHQKIIKDVVEPTVRGIQQEGFDYRGVIFIGLMVTDQGPQVLEYNIRFGDPETQVLLPLLDGDWGQAFLDIAEGQIPQLKWKSDFANACVVLAAENYPGTPVKGVEITGDLQDKDYGYFLHAGTTFKEGHWLTAGGRVLNAIGFGENIKEAIEKAYQVAEQASWPGQQKRMDIGKNQLSR